MMFSSSVRNVQPDYMDYSRPIPTGPNDLPRRYENSQAAFRWVLADKGQVMVMEVDEHHLPQLRTIPLQGICF
jgi:hypothetical protein